MGKTSFSVLDTHDILSGRKALLEAQGLSADFFYTTETQERIALERADLVVAIKDTEAAFFRKLAATPVVTIGHVDRVVAANATPMTRNIIRLGYIGSENPVNQVNLSRFLDRLFPLEPTLVGKVEVVIAGLISKFAASLPMARSVALKILGPVDDVASFYHDECDVVISPFEFGTGLKIKTVEAVCYGKPVIGTRDAFDGIETTEPMHAYKTVEEMVGGIRDLVADRALLERLATASNFAAASMRQRYHDGFQTILSAAACRRFVFVTNVSFWNERDVFQRRTAVFLRMLKSIAHVHVVCGQEVSLEDLRLASEWQWGTTILFNTERGVSARDFVEQQTRSLDAFVSIYQTAVYGVVACPRLIVDLTGGEVEEWVSLLSNDKEIIVTSLIASDPIYVEQANTAIRGSVPSLTVGLPDLGLSMGQGNGIAIFCDDVADVLSLAAVLEIDLCGFDHSPILLVMSKPESNFPARDALPSYVELRIATTQDAAIRTSDDLLLAVDMGTSDPLKNDVKIGLLNRGVKTFDVGPLALGAEDVRAWVRLLLRSDIQRRRIASLCHKAARDRNAPNFTEFWCRSIEQELLQSRDKIMGKSPVVINADHLEPRI